MYTPILLILYIWPLKETAAVSSIQSCVHDTYRTGWWSMDRLKINPDKTEILILGTRQQLQKAIYYFTPCCWWISNISPSTKVKNLGSWFDSNLDMLSHVNNICSLSFYYIYNRRRIRKYLSHQTANYLLSMRILPVNWTTATVYYMAFLLFTLINFIKSSKCCC